MASLTIKKNERGQADSLMLEAAPCCAGDLGESCLQYVAGPDLAKVQAQVESNNVLWDVIDGLAGFGDTSLWEPIDFNIVDPYRFVVKPLPFAVFTGIWCGGIAWDPSRTAHPAKNFSEFWDVNNFPGRAVSLTADTEACKERKEKGANNPIHEKAYAKAEAKVPFRISVPDDIANTALFLAGPRSDQISGAVISVNGGLSFP